MYHSRLELDRSNFEHFLMTKHFFAKIQIRVSNIVNLAVSFITLASTDIKSFCLRFFSSPLMRLPIIGKRWKIIRKWWKAENNIFLQLQNGLHMYNYECENRQHSGFLCFEYIVLGRA
jgi:hypothetical protein